MPFAVLTRIREVSSEDGQHLAENLIKFNGGKKWKTKSPGEKSAYVILEMEEAQQITGIDIGNEHSAFIEVLVGKFPEDFKEILITCSFMTPIESRNSNNANRVRCFSGDALVPEVAEKKWSLVKIICTQPFNKHVQYGLSFIKVHVAQACPAKTSVGAGTHKKTDVLDSEKLSSPFHFKLREVSPDSENDAASSLFCRWKNRKEEKIVETITAAVSARKAATDTVPYIRGVIEKTKTSQQNESNKMDVRDRNREDLFFKDADSTTKSEREVRLAKEIESDREKLRLALQKQEENKQKAKRKSIDVVRQKTQNDKEKDECSTVESASRNADKQRFDNTQKRRRSTDERPSKKARGLELKLRPFNQLLKGVVLVISGIQNPDRADLRNKAISMGAKYKGDWDNTCTHLICAFKNTPKYNQVKGKGKIITKSWLEKCYDSKKYLPWRRFALDSGELKKPESDEEILDESLSHAKDKADNSKRESEERNETLSLYDLDELPAKVSVQSTSESDTDDEIKRIEERRKSIENQNISSSKGTVTKEDEIQPNHKELNGTSKSSSGNIYEASTDEEEYLQCKQKSANGLYHTKS